MNRIAFTSAFLVLAAPISSATAPVISAAALSFPRQDPGTAKPTKEDFEKQFAAIKKEDSKAFLALAQWAEKGGLSAEAKKAYRAVLDGDANNDLARSKLGYVKVGGEWVTKEKAAELEKAKGADPKKKGGKTGGPVVPTVGVEKDIANNAHADLEEGKRLAKLMGDTCMVVSSAHFSIKGAVSREQAKDGLAAAEQAYAELNVIFERGVDEQPLGMRKLTIYFAKDDAGCKELVPYIEDNHGKLDPYLRDDIMKKATGLAANGAHPVSLTQNTVDIRSYVLHQLGQVYVDCIGAAPDPWLEEGFAMYTAVRWAGKNTTYCYNPSSYAGNVGGSKKGEDTAYTLICKEIAQDKTDSPIEVLAKKKLNQLDDKDLAKSFSLVKMLIEKEPETGLAFLRLYSSQNVARVLKASYKLSPAEFDERWRQAQK
ncbi:MAG: hypothetical protein HY286_09920 [Planctomycetes bacterium]|nr:hypothetical protein [Planctomycetota bacterium]